MGEIIMDKWQRMFAGKLENVRKHWLERFERTAEELIAPAFAEYDAFTTSRGFTVTAPACDAGARLYKFGLTENGYLMMWLRLRGLEQVETHVEVYVPGSNPLGQTLSRKPIAHINGEWVHEQFRTALDRFVECFDAASRAQANRLPAGAGA